MIKSLNLFVLQNKGAARIARSSYRCIVMIQKQNDLFVRHSSKLEKHSVQVFADFRSRNVVHLSTQTGYDNEKINIMTLHLQKITASKKLSICPVNPEDFLSAILWYKNLLRSRICYLNIFLGWYSDMTTCLQYLHSSTEAWNGRTTKTSGLSV